MQHVAEQADYRFDYARVTPEVWNQASALNGPDLYSYEPEPTLLVPVFDAGPRQSLSFFVLARGFVGVG